MHFTVTEYDENGCVLNVATFTNRADADMMFPIMASRSAQAALFDTDENKMLEGVCNKCRTPKHDMIAYLTR